ncbi:MAG: hypothetical protein AAGF95_32180 [Chloroflexota bacterium]
MFREVVRTFIDDFLMSPELAPFTIFVCVLLIGVSLISILTGSDEAFEELED